MDLLKMSKTELIAKCNEIGITNTKSKKKEELINLINNTNVSKKIKLIIEDDSDSEENIVVSADNVINNEPTTDVNALDLYKSNEEILKSIIKDDQILKIIKEKYNKSNNQNENIYNFIYSYINGMKMIHQDYKNFNYSLYQSIIANNNVKILWGNCLDRLKSLPSESVGLMCTSPPYYNARDYSTWNNLNDYLSFMTDIIKECYRVLDNHRVFVFNVSDVVDNDNLSDIKCWGERKIPLPSYFVKIFEDCGFTYVDDIIWDKGEVQSSRHKNKSTPYPFYQYPINCYEHILIFHKHRLEKDVKYPCSVCGSLNIKSNSYTYKGLRSWECCNPDCDRSDSDRGKRFSLKTIITQDENKQKLNMIPSEFVDNWRRDIHKLTPVIKINGKKENKLGHTAPYPFEIPEMAIRYYSYEGDIVLDMFGGSFTTAIQANKLNRIGVGIELRKDLFEECIKNNITNHGCNFTEL
jgi:DNA modification methylase